MITGFEYKTSLEKANSIKTLVCRSARYLSASILLATLLTSPVLAQEDNPLNFDVNVSMDICPEYKLGGIELEIFYRTGIDTKLAPAEVVSLNIDAANSTAVARLRFPSFFGTIPFHVSARCRNAVTPSDNSTERSFSNCDRIALFDTDRDGIPNHLEDTNCDNFFSPGDLSNPDNVDTDGDGVRDLVENVMNFDPTNPGSSPFPFVYSSSPFDPDQDGNANPYVWRSATGEWFIKDFAQAGSNISFSFGLPGDIPFTYDTVSDPSDVGVIRNVNNQYLWYFHGNGFEYLDGSRSSILGFGIFGDNVIPGPWETAGVTNPAVTRLFNGEWTFFILNRDGSFRMEVFGGNGDVPKVDDYDGDGIFDIAVFRPSESKTFVRRSSDDTVQILDFGTGTSEHTVKGDYSGDGASELSFWEPRTGMFSSLLSDNGFDPEKAADKDPDFYFELQLGLFAVHLPLNWNLQNGKLLYTVVDHSTGTRFHKPNNDPDAPPQAIQWGLAGDHLG